ncbi:MAG: hypothetical protein ACOX0Y_08525 [Thiopseudomonas sp.]
MSGESVVYGYIKDWLVQDRERQLGRAEHNRRVLGSLPHAEAWELLHRDMFAASHPQDQLLPVSQVIHFAATYRSVEYEWSTWVGQFEAVLKCLYWSTAVVHLEAEYHGSHRFSWQSDSYELLTPEQQLGMRCVWEHERGPVL